MPKPQNADLPLEKETELISLNDNGGTCSQFYGMYFLPHVVVIKLLLFILMQPFSQTKQNFMFSGFD